MQRYYPWFDEEIGYLGPTDKFDANRMYTIPLHERWEDINRVTPILNYCDFLARIEANIPPNEHDILTTHQAAILHLLCIGIDAWASGGRKWLEFGQWIEMESKPKNEPHGLVQRNEMLNGLADNVRNAQDKDAQEVLRSGLVELHKVYKQNFGVGRKFRQFFATLPDPVKPILLEHYVIGKNANPRDVERAWRERNPDDNVALIAKYLWDCRRNKFSHEAKVDDGSIPDWFRLLGEVKHVPRADGSFSTTAEWVVSSNVPEHILVRSALVASIRQAVFNDVARSHARTHLRKLIRRYYSDSPNLLPYLKAIGLNVYD